MPNQLRVHEPIVSHSMYLSISIGDIFEIQVVATDIAGQSTVAVGGTGSVTLVVSTQWTATIGNDFSITWNRVG